MSPLDILNNIKAIQPIDDCIAITEGSSNPCFKVISGTEQFFVKIFINVTNEQVPVLQQRLAVYHLAGDNHISPKVVEYDATQRYLVTEFISCHSLSKQNISPEDKLSVLAKAMSSCHKLQATPLITVDELDLSTLISELANTAQLSAKQIISLTAYCQPILAKIDQHKSMLTTVHGDLNYGNVLFDQEQLLVVDWDCFTVAEIEFDIAMALSINCIESSQHSYLINMYHKYADNRLEISQCKVTRYFVLCNFINGLWYLSYGNNKGEGHGDKVLEFFIDPLLDTIAKQ